MFPHFYCVQKSTKCAGPADPVVQLDAGRRRRQFTAKRRRRWVIVSPAAATAESEEAPSAPEKC